MTLGSILALTRMQHTYEVTLDFVFGNFKIGFGVKINVNKTIQKFKVSTDLWHIKQNISLKAK